MSSDDPENNPQYWRRFRTASFCLFALSIAHVVFFTNKTIPRCVDLGNDLCLARVMMEKSNLLKEALQGWPGGLPDKGFPRKAKNRVRFGDAAHEFSRLEFEVVGAFERRGRCLMLLEAEAGSWRPLHFRFYSRDGVVNLSSEVLLAEFQAAKP